MIRMTLSLVLALSAMAIVLAQAAPGTPVPQPQPGGGMGMRGGMPGIQGMQPSVEMTVTPNGVFVLKSGVLVKYDTTLKQQGTSLELFGPLAVQPTVSNPPTDEERQRMRTWLLDAAPRMSPAAMLADGDELLIVVGNTLFRVNQKTLALDTKQAKLLGENNPLQNRPFAAMTAMMGSKPVLQLSEKTLFIILGSDLVAVNAETGDVLGNGVLPKETNIDMTNLRGVFGGGGAGAGRGNRGGGRNNNNAPDAVQGQQ